MRVRGHRAAHGIGHLLAERPAHDEVGQVDRGRPSGRGDQAAPCHEPFRQGFGTEGRQLVEHEPVGRGVVPFEDSGSTQEQCPGGHRGRPLGRGVRMSHPRDEARIADQAPAAESAGDDEHVRLGAVLE